jgi:Glucose-6-phosphate dehydrogenase subunit
VATSVAEIERDLATMRGAEATNGTPYQRTSVMTHIAWVPEPWVGAAENVLAGLAERHPSRTIVLLPEPERGGEGLDAEVEIDCFPVGTERSICTETIRIRVRGDAMRAPASVVQPLLISDLPVFLRWRGEPGWESDEFAQLVDVADRLIVDSTEWEDLPAPYARLVEMFDHVAISDIAWERTSRWRAQLATLWPGIADVHSVRVTGTHAQGQLLAGWLRSRLRHDVDLEVDPADRLVGVEVDGEPTPFPAGAAPDPADLLSDQLDRFSRDRVYEDAVRAVAP